MENETSTNHKNGNDANRLLEVGFSVVDYCKCKCGQFVSPSEAVNETKILYDDKRENVIGFSCWKCDEWIAFPKTYR
jgi:hypothetical protein